MSNFQSFLKEQASIEKTRRERTSALVESWKPTKLLNGLNKDDQHELAQLLQNQTNQLIREATRTSTQAGSEEWSGIALPMVRKIFTEQLAKELVHVQSMDRPNGLVFFLDFEVDGDKPSAKPIFNADESVYGVTDEVTDPNGGFYGNDRFAYSQYYQDAEATVVDEGTAVLKDVDFDPNLADAITANEILYYDVTVPANLNADLLALESFIVADASVDTVYRRYTTQVDATTVRFFFTSSTLSSDGTTITGTPATTVDLHYVVQPTASNRGDFEMGQGSITGADIPELNLKVNSREIIAKTRKLKTVMTPEIIQDLGAYHNMDAQKEMADLVSKYVTQETDTEILRMLARASRNITRYWSALPGRYINAKTGANSGSQPDYFHGPSEWYKTLGIRIRDVSNEIHRRTLRGGANWIVTSSKIATILESFNTFRTVQDNDTTYGMGTEKVGTLDGRITIYKNPYFPDQEMLLGFKGSSFLESGAAYGVYVPFQLTPPLTDPDDFTVKQGMITRDAKIVLRSEFYARIVVQDTETV